MIEGIWRSFDDPAKIVVPRVMTMACARRAIAWKREQLEAAGHPMPDGLRVMEPYPECLPDPEGWVSPVVIGIWQTGESWALLINIEDGRLRLQRIRDR